MKNREFLMLANPYDPLKHQVAGMFASEKLDGQRCWWDGGYTRGWKKKDVPWANTDKDERYKEEQISTGMWSRYGNVIHASNEFLDRLPQVSLDGELWVGRGQKQILDRIIKKIVPIPEEWRMVKYMCFDSPCYASVLQDGKISNLHFKKVFRGIMDKGIVPMNPLRIFDVTYKYLKNILNDWCHEQTQLSFKQEEAKEQLESMMSKIISQGGEGVVLRKGFWQPYRCDDLLKWKSFTDDEGTVLAVNDGKDRIEGLMGSLTVLWKDKTFDVGTGFSDQARNREYLGKVITFRYRDVTEEGIPKEARFLRIRDEE